MSEHPVKLEPSWKARIGDYLLRPEMQALAAFLRAEKQAGKRIYPPGPEIFAAFEHTPFDAVRVRSEERRVGKECRSRWSPYH